MTMKTFAFFLFLFCTKLLIFSQSSNDIQNSFTASLNFHTNPSQIYEQNGIRMVANLEKCDNPSIGMLKDYIYFNIKNTNSFAVNITLEEQLYFNNLCKTCGDQEYLKTFSLKPNETLSSSCVEPTPKAYKIFYGSPWVSETLTKFVLVNINIEKQ